MAQSRSPRFTLSDGALAGTGVLQASERYLCLVTHGADGTAQHCEYCNSTFPPNRSLAVPHARAWMLIIAFLNQARNLDPSPETTHLVLICLTKHAALEEYTKPIKR